MQVLEGRLVTGNRFRITPYVVQVTTPNGEVIRNVETQSLGDTQRRQNVVTCWMRDGSSFKLSFDTVEDAGQAAAVLQGGMRPGSATNFVAGISPRQVATALCALGLIIGSFGPWAKVWVVTTGGLDGDGKITIVLGILALVGIFSRVRQPNGRSWITYGLVAAFGIAAAVGAYDWNTVGDAIGALEDNPFAANASVGWGLQLMTISAVVGTVLGFVEAMDARRGES